MLVEDRVTSLDVISTFKTPCAAASGFQCRSVQKRARWLVLWSSHHGGSSPGTILPVMAQTCCPLSPALLSEEAPEEPLAPEEPDEPEEVRARSLPAKFIPTSAHPFLGEGSPTNVGYRKKGTLILTPSRESLVMQGRQPSTARDAALSIGGESAPLTAFRQRGPQMQQVLHALADRGFSIKDDGGNGGVPCLAWLVR